MAPRSAVERASSQLTRFASPSVLIDTTMAWFIIFAASVFALYFWRDYRIQQQDLQSATSPLRAGERYIGQVITLTDEMRDGDGSVKLGTRRWRLRGPTVPAGTRVRVTGVDGVVLIVDRLPG